MHSNLIVPELTKEICMELIFFRKIVIMHEQLAVHMRIA